ncbi:hypothetical protein V6B95_05615 [Thermoanaerobacterium saccharolyticum]
MFKRGEWTIMHIGLLYFEGCPNSEPALRLLKEVLSEKILKMI